MFFSHFRELGTPFCIYGERLAIVQMLSHGSFPHFKIVSVFAPIVCMSKYESLLNPELVFSGNIKSWFANISHQLKKRR